MGTLQVDDHVFDEQGKPCRVLALSEIDDTEQAYQITFRDGSSITAGERHLWDIEYIIGKTRPMLMSTGELYKATMRHRARNKGKPDERRSIVRIPVAKPLALEPANLPVDPYVMGSGWGTGMR